MAAKKDILPWLEYITQPLGLLIELSRFIGEETN
jgi:hypothetical protein